VDYEVIDIFSPDWLSEFRRKRCDGYMLRPPVATALWRNTYLKRLWLIRDELEGRCVPTLDSILYYESKILMADRFKLAKLPHPKTDVFFRFRDAWKHVSTTSLPKIVKTDGGSAGLGVRLITSRTALRLYLIRSFMTNYVARGFHSICDLRKFLGTFFASWRVFFRTDMQYFIKPEISQGCFIIQDAVEIATEWRIVVIGKSFFGHQKLSGKNRLHSGSGCVGWVAPPFELLDQVKVWCEALNLNAMTFDIFEDAQGDYYVNEMQAVMGAYAPSQMYINDIPGRYVYAEGGWTFEEGEFCRHSCNVLRVEVLIEHLQHSQG